MEKVLLDGAVELAARTAAALNKANKVGTVQYRCRTGPDAHQSVRLGKSIGQKSYPWSILNLSCLHLIGSGRIGLDLSGTDVQQPGVVREWPEASADLAERVETCRGARRGHVAVELRVHASGGSRVNRSAGEYAGGIETRTGCRRACIYSGWPALLCSGPCRDLHLIEISPRVILRRSHRLLVHLRTPT
jgi:hypothetical protein